MGPKKACTGRGTSMRIAAAGQLVLLALIEDLQQFLVDAAAAVEALVDDERLLAAVIDQVLLELLEQDGASIALMCR